MAILEGERGDLWLLLSTELCDRCWVCAETEERGDIRLL